MLVLTRKRGETVVLPDLDVEITIQKLRGGKVKVGVQAPAGIRICRGELLNREQQNDHRASGIAAS